MPARKDCFALFCFVCEPPYPKPEALRLIKRDEDEALLLGQRTRDTFQLADVFVKLSEDAYKKQLERFLDLIFGFPFHTPEPAASYRPPRLGPPFRGRGHR